MTWINDFIFFGSKCVVISEVVNTIMIGSVFELYGNEHSVFTSFNHHYA